LVFIEARLRTVNQLGSAGASITVEKQKKLTAKAKHFLHKNNETSFDGRACHFDIALMNNAYLASH